ncbi:MAG: hypothetical protein EHM35_01565 [Planctomycetaceae bacterium]|nr:MAG: hypothetical protein EHM35_01565 [Planctomycetaceae bacterium]
MSHPIKWLRRNNKKIMAVVVIVLMFAFVGGSALEYLLQPSGGIKNTYAYYGKKARITHMMVGEANAELEILQALQADAVLQQQDLRGILLGELLFSQSRSSPALMNQVMQMIRRNQFLISDKQLGEMYDRTALPAVYWVLLTQEAESAGIRIPTTDVGDLLGRRLIPQLFRGQDYQTVMNGLVNRFRASEEDILEVFGKLLAVLQYAQTICSVEDVTIPQLMHMASSSGSTLDAEIVQLPARAFVDKQNQPADDVLQAQFDKYKGSFPGAVTQDNPFGFGYKLPDRLQLEYVALKLQDVAGIVPAPTQEEAEIHYRQNRQRLYTKEVPSDPNDPNSPKTQQVTSYAEVAETIMEQLRKERIITKATQILEEVRTTADAKLAELTVEGKEPSVEQLKDKAGQYDGITKELTVKYSIPMFNGQTGWLNAVDMQMDKYLGRLVVSSQGATSSLRLSQLLFSVKDLGENAAILMFAQAPRMHTTIGPASDPMVAMSPDLSGQIMMVVKITGISKAAEPENLNVIFTTRTIDLGDASAKKDDVYSVREKVTEDVQRLTAWDTTKSRAEEFVALAKTEGWNPAITKFNNLYGKQAKKDPNDPNVFKLDNLNGLQRISNAQLQVVATQTLGNPAAAMIANETQTEKQLIDRFYSLVPANADSAANLPQILEFKPSQSFYAVKSVSVKWLNQQQYDSMKGVLLQQEDFIQTQNLAVVHFNPANILKRLNYRPARPAEEPAQEADTAEPKSKDAA